MKYTDFAAYERKWQEYWQLQKTYSTPEITWGMKKKYILDMFPYPSGAGLHVGHPLGYIGTDIIARFYRMQGYAVLHPMGWDAFGLPAENYAIKTGVHPRLTTEKNVERFKNQLISLGLSYDWDREINTTDPSYYKWTQWIFLKLYEKGLAYEAIMPINWCPSCKTGIANEEVVKDGECERCGSRVEQKPLRQWVLKITEYAERLLEDLDELDWPESIKEMQRHWVGKSIGATMHVGTYFAGEEKLNEMISIYTTRLDTVFGMQFLAIAPEHPLLETITTSEYAEEVHAYCDHARKKNTFQRTELSKEKTGVFTGSYVKNPFNGDMVPVYVCDYVIGFYGTGAVMGVPAHDERDFVFAHTYGLGIREVVLTTEGESKVGDQPFTEEGILVDSGDFSGMTSAEARVAMTNWLTEHGRGEQTTNYKLRDWVFSRQRYWGEPIPVIHTSNGIQPLDEKDLPLLLPDVEQYEPSGTGESPLATIDTWVNTPEGKRETNTMPQWAGSCWYYLRFIDPHNKDALADMEKLKTWLPVDIYVGGAEHAVLHLLYARFWHKVLYDLGVVPTKEPFQNLVNQGLILAEDNTKMSKSKGNVINPDDIVQEYGCDTFRMYEMFMAPFESVKPWSTKSILGVYRFLQKVWNLKDAIHEDKQATEEELRILHQTIKKVTEDIPLFSFNTAVAQMMVCTNTLQDQKVGISRETYTTFLRILAPFAPHMTEELMSQLGENTSVHLAEWPEWNERYLRVTKLTYVVQVNGKVRANLEVEDGIAEDTIEEMAKNEPHVAKYLEGQQIKKVIHVSGKLVNIVI